MYRYLIIIERGDNNYSAYSPDLPGCVAVGDTPQEVEKNMESAIEFHIEGMLEEGLSIPEPTTMANYVSVAVG